MRVVSRLTLCGLAVGLVAMVASSAADDLAPLLKTITPGKSQLRVRIPMTGGTHDISQISGKVSGGGTQQKKEFDVRVALSSQPGQCHIAAKKLESWGFPVPKNREFILPELLIPAVQIAPEAKQGRDVVVRFTNIKLQVVDVPAAAMNNIYTCDFSLTITELFKGTEKTMEPRLAFKDEFLELSVNANAVKSLGTNEMAVPEITPDAAPELVPAVGPMTLRNGYPVFAYASVNGMESYKMANGTVVPVNVKIVSVINWDPGVVISIGLARACKVEMDQSGMGEVGVGVQANTQVLPGKMKEFRLGFYTGPGFKTQKDFVLKDYTVVVDKNSTEGFIWLGRKFITKYFKDGVYATGSDGVWKMHGRLDPELLFDIKTRKKADPKEQEPKK